MRWPWDHPSQRTVAQPLKVQAGVAHAPWLSENTVIIHVDLRGGRQGGGEWGREGGREGEREGEEGR